jgi:flagellar motor switch protein FliM
MQVEDDARAGFRWPGRVPASQGDLYDFTRPDRIPQPQVRAIQLVYENAARSLSASLSAHLATYVNVTAAGFAQTSYREFIQAMPSPSVIATVGLKPFDTLGVLDLTPELVFPVLEMMMGRRSRFGPPAGREVTDIELRLIEGVIRIVLQDLREAWKAIGPMEFKLQTISKEPQFVQALAPGEAVLAVPMAVQIGDAEASMHLAIPAVAAGRMSQGKGPQWKSAAAPSAAEQEETLALIGLAETRIEVEMCPASIGAADLMSLEEGDLLISDHSIQRAFYARINGRPSMTGDIVRAGRNLAFEIHDFFESAADAQSDTVPAESNSGSST